MIQYSYSSVTYFYLVVNKVDYLISLIRMMSSQYTCVYEANAKVHGNVLNNGKEHKTST